MSAPSPHRSGRGRREATSPSIRGSIAGSLLAALVLGGCVHYNSIYNAERSLAQAEAHRQAGLDSSAAALYRDAVRKASAGFRKDPSGKWADDALLIGGRASLRLGWTARAEELLRAASEQATDAETEAEATIYRAAALSRLGRSRTALEILTPVLGELDPGAAFATGYLVRARIRMERGMSEGANRDLRTASAVSGEFAAEVALARLAMAIERRRPEEALDAVDQLISEPGVSKRTGALISLMEEGSRVLQLNAALGRLAAARDAVWHPEERDRVRLAASRLLLEMGDTASAFSAALELARNGAATASARKWIVMERLKLVEDPRGLVSIRDFLRPVETDSAAARLVAELSEVLALTASAGNEPLALFVAGELARDGLGADRLARRLFTDFCELDPNGTWTGKALLAALALADSETEAALLRRRLSGLANDPYVEAAGGAGSSEEVGELDERLATRMREIRARQTRIAS